MHDSVCPQPADTARSARPPYRQTWPLNHSFLRQLDMVRYGSLPVSVKSGEMISTDFNWSTGRVGAVGEEDRTDQTLLGLNCPLPALTEYAVMIIEHGI